LRAEIAAELVGALPSVEAQVIKIRLERWDHLSDCDEWNLDKLHRQKALIAAAYRPPGALAPGNHV
jgi:hypothetical protein